jgi:hypothetical protein
MLKYLPFNFFTKLIIWLVICLIDYAVFHYGNFDFLTGWFSIIPLLILAPFDIGSLGSNNNNPKEHYWHATSDSKFD